METAIVSDFSSFQSMRAEWNELADNFASPLLRHEWVSACIEALYPKGALPAIFIVHSGGRLRAAAPLMSVRRIVMRDLETPGNALLEPSGFIYDGEEALMILLDAIRETRRSFRLARLSRDAKETLALKHSLAKGCVHMVRDGASSLRIPLKRTWKDFEASISSGRRSDLRRFRRRAESLGEVTFEAVHPDVHTVSKPMEELLRIEASGWKGQSRTAILSQPHIRDFYERYARSAAEQGILRFFFLRIDGTIIAARMAVEHNRRLWDLRLGCDESWSRCAPGVLLTQETLRYAVDRGLDAYEFLGSAEAWERHWPCDEDHYISFRTYPYSLKGQFAFAQDGCRVAFRKAASAMQAGFDWAMRKMVALPGATLYFEEALPLIH